MNKVDKYSELLIQSTDTIRNLDETMYPSLAKFLHKRNDAYLRRLLFLIEIMTETDNLEYDDLGFGYFFISLTYLSKIGAQYARSTGTWESTIVLFTCLGLIKRKVPTRYNAITPYEKEAVNIAEDNGHKHAIEFISIERYDLKQLDYIERKAELWMQNKASVIHFSKTVIIDVFGSYTANRVYGDERRKPRKQIECELILKEILAAILQNKSFTDKTELLQIAAEYTYTESSNNHTFDECYRLFRRTWERCSYRILKETGVKHRRPTNEEKERFGLIGNGWILISESLLSINSIRWRDSLK